MYPSDHRLDPASVTSSERSRREHRGEVLLARRVPRLPSALSRPDLPIYLIQGCPNPFASGEPESSYTTDPDKALISGKCADFNRIKGPIPPGLAARAPYFHNGAAPTLNEAVNCYNQRFNMQLTDEQKSDLVAFLNSL